MADRVVVHALIDVYLPPKTTVRHILEQRSTRKFEETSMLYILKDAKGLAIAWNGLPPGHKTVAKWEIRRPLPATLRKRS